MKGLADREFLSDLTFELNAGRAMLDNRLSSFEKP